MLYFAAINVLIPSSTELFWTLSAAGKASGKKKTTNNCSGEKVYEKNPNKSWRGTKCFPSFQILWNFC